MLFEACPLHRTLRARAVGAEELSAGTSVGRSRPQCRSPDHVAAALRFGHDRNLSAHDGSAAQFACAKALRLIRQAAREAVGCDDVHTVAGPRVAETVVDVDVVVHDDGVMPAAVPASVPGVVALARGQRNPTDVAVGIVVPSDTETEVEAAMTVPAEEADKCGPPIVVAIVRARVPTPAVAGVVEPAAVVIRSPAPGLVAHPGPAVVVDIAPPSLTVRRPVGPRAWEPAVAVA